MSKKSRKRNKRLLMLAALAGGAAFLGRGKKKFGTDAGFLKSGAAGGASLKKPLVDAADAGTTFIKKKAAVVPLKKPADDSWLDVPAGPHGSGGKGDYWRKQKAKIKTAVAPPGILNPYKAPIGPGTGRVNWRAKGGRIGAKKGGSVTGIAKRGFGRALKKK